MMKKLLSGDGEAVGLARTNVYWGGLCNEVGEGDASSFASHCRVVFYGSIKSEPARMLTIFSPEDLISVCFIDGSSQQNGIGPGVKLHFYARAGTQNLHASSRCCLHIRRSNDTERGEG